MAKFRARARAVDLLGRQQIAGIPTAVHELFKNAHDAYADHVEVDYLRRSGLFVLRDDGVGMTKEEFEDRWLVVGTESKVTGPNKMSAPPIDAKKPERPVLGEKGIGRLAIGIIGKQVLVLSRAVRNGEQHPRIAAFIHWDVFSLPGVNLADIEIPLVELPEDAPTDGALVATLVGRFRDGVESLVADGEADRSAVAAMVADLDNFALSPAEIEAKLPGPDSLRLAAGQRGTQFWVLPSDPVLVSDLEAPDKESVSPIERQLLGFANTLSPGAPAPVMRAAFRDHRSAVDMRDLLDPSTFFEPGELENADHYLQGAVDAKGRFLGTVSVFGEVHKDVVVPFSGLAGRDTRCGPFEVQIAYVQGNRRESTLPDEAWWRFIDKANKLGGVYVYADGVRILPYGAPSVDWLEIEEKRSRSAAFYFWSHRRMCGAVQLTKAANGGLRQKAGREGFIEDAAFRDLREVMKTLLQDLAARFFRKGTEQGDVFLRAKNANKRRNAAIERAAASVKARKVALRMQLEATFARIEDGAPQREAEAVALEVQGAFEAALDRDDDGLPAYLIRLERESRDRVKALAASYAVTIPRVARSKALDAEVRRYQMYAQELEDTVFAPLETRVEQVAFDAIAVATDHADRYKRLLAALEGQIQEGKRELDKLRKEVTRTLGNRSAELRQGADDRVREFHEEGERIIGRAAAIPASDLDDARLSEERRALVKAVIEAAEQPQQDMQRVIDQLDALSWDAAGDPLEQRDAMEQLAIESRERLDDELEDAQLGMTVEIISHELDHTVRDIHGGLRAMKVWADKNPRLRQLHDDLRAAFEHLDGYLTLFRPLQRRLYRSAIEFNGQQILDYLRRLFEPRLRELGVELRASERFCRTTLLGYPSTYYPVFVNVLDNALWWLKGRAEPVIELDADLSSLTIWNNGPRIAPEDRELVFEHRFSLKPGGRGLGLTLSRDAMRGIQGDLRLDDTAEGTGFRVVIPDGARVVEES